LATLVLRAGRTDVEWTNLTGGIVALHRATNPVA
jgi:ubiquinone/menaquinone biosynthesis C-methylase UbiE